jgi:hypothetical protein
MSSITIQDKLACVVRELGYRQHVYPRLIASKKLSQSQADRQIAVMEAIVEDYRRSAQVCIEPEEDLFGSNAA